MLRAFGLAVALMLAAAILFVLADRYVMHIQSVTNDVRTAKLKQVSVIFGGDMMFDRSVRKVVEKKGGDFIFSCIERVLQDADFVVANLEGPITQHASVSALSSMGDEFNYTFTFSPETAELLHNHNIRVVNLGNNHILNFGREGVRSTISELEKAGVWYFGDPIYHSVHLEHAFSPIVFAFINYNEFNALAGSGKAASTTIKQIQLVRATGALPIVYAHWGIEYATTSSANSRELAHRFVDAGAGIVIGSHPHVVQEHEVYNNKHIYYSLGNFIFDQYFSEDVTHGLLLNVAFNQDGVQSVKEIPIELGRDRRTCAIE